MLRQRISFTWLARQKKKSTSSHLDEMPVITVCSGLRLFDVLGLRPSVALFHVKAHLVAFCQALEPGHINGGVVNKYVLPVVLLNKTISLLFTKPLYGPFWQITDPLSETFQYGSNPRLAPSDPRTNQVAVIQVIFTKNVNNLLFGCKGKSEIDRDHCWF
jgi:hypothetical protein